VLGTHQPDLPELVVDLRQRQVQELDAARIGHRCELGY